MKSSIVTLIIFISFMITFCLIILSMIILLIPKYKKYFTFFSRDLWMIYIIGSLFVICSEVSKFGRMTLFKCYLFHYMITLGYTMTLLPLLYKLIINFPQINKYSKWIKKNKLIFISFIIFIETLLNLLLFISPFKLKDIIVENNKNFSKCKLDETFGKIILSFQIFTKIILYISINILIFLEWNIKETYTDIRAFTINMGLDGILLALFLIISFININNYVIYYSLHTCIILFFVITNHTYIFIIRIWFDNSNKEKTVEDKLVDKLFNNNNNVNKDNSLVLDVINSSIVDNTENKIERSNSSKSKTKYKSRILSYHFAQTSSIINDDDNNINRRRNRSLSTGRRKSKLRSLSINNKNRNRSISVSMCRRRSKIINRRNSTINSNINNMHIHNYNNTHFHNINFLYNNSNSNIDSIINNINNLSNNNSNSSFNSLNNNIDSINNKNHIPVTDSYTHNINDITNNDSSSITNLNNIYNTENLNSK